MKIRASWSPAFEGDEQDGVICRCGRFLFFDKKDLTPPVTYVVCPVCGHVTTYCTREQGGTNER